MKGLKLLSTSNEIKIASQLTFLKAKIFLESRAYIRASLSDLFNINPMEIPLIANPGEPPSLSENMGYVSISHCKDALIVAWYKDKIGIDIERIDRDFNYEAIAKKYFINKNCKLDKKSILNQWCATEAAIKWDKGKLANDIKEWEYQEDNKFIYHKSKKIKIQLSQLSFMKWTISIAYKNKTNIDNKFIICSEILNC